MITLRLLGSTELRRDGETLDSFLSGAKRLALLAYLVLADRGGYHRRDKLLALFWSERSTESARSALSNMVYHIRRELGDEVLVNRGTSEIGVNFDLLTCDVFEFEQALEAGNPAAALDLYDGDLLTGLHVPDASTEFELWLEQERERLRLRAAGAAWTLADEAESARNYRDARTWARRAAAFSPFSDEDHARLIRLLARTGDRAGAQAAYAAFADRLKSEWDMEPTDELQSLVKEDMPAPPVGHEQGGMEPDDASPSRDTFEPAPAAFSASSGPDRRPESSRDRQEVTTSTKRPWTWILAGSLAVFVLLIAALAWNVWRDESSTLDSPLVPPRQDLTIAVLPFTYLGAEDSMDYFSLGVTEEILVRLARVRALSVTSRTSVMQYQDTDKNLPVIAEELGVAHVVEGSIQMTGNQVRISVQLIDARTDKHLWAESYDRPVQDILTVQNDVAVRVAEALQAELLPHERERLAGARDVDQDAYHLYLRAQYLRHQLEPTGIVTAVELFEQAIDEDPTFAPAHAGLSISLAWWSILGDLPRATPSLERGVQKTLEAADRALRLDSTLVEPYLARGLVHEFITGEREKSRRALEEAVTLHPGSSESLQEFGWHLLRVGEAEKSLSFMREALRLDPQSWSAHFGFGYALYCNREFEAGIQALETALSLGTRYEIAWKHTYVAHITYARKLILDGESVEADMHATRAGELMSELLGHHVDWAAVTAGWIRGETMEPFEPKTPGDRTSIGLYESLITGNQEKALDLLENQIEPEDIFRFRVFAEPIYDTVRDEPRFRKMVDEWLR